MSFELLVFKKVNEQSLGILSIFLHPLFGLHNYTTITHYFYAFRAVWVDTRNAPETPF
jgi:hypothetical protein